MKIILLFISFIFSIKCNCPIACPNCESLLSTEEDMHCIECDNGYYFLYNTKNCYGLEKQITLKI